MREPVEQRGGELLVAAEDFDPLAEGQVGGDDDAAALVAVGEHVEEQLAAHAVEGHEAELVDDEQLDAVQSALQPTKLSRITSFYQRAHQVGGACEEYSAACASSFDAEGNREMRFAGADGAGEDDVVGIVDPAPACELGDLSGSHRSLGGGEIEGV